MSPSLIARIVAAVPERRVRVHSGTRFAPPAHAGAGAPLAHLARYLSWLSPLNALGPEDRGLLGQLAPHAKSALRADDGEELDSESSTLVGD